MKINKNNIRFILRFHEIVLELKVIEDAHFLIIVVNEISVIVNIMRIR